MYVSTCLLGFQEGLLLAADGLNHCFPPWFISSIGRIWHFLPGTLMAIITVKSQFLISLKSIVGAGCSFQKDFSLRNAHFLLSLSRSHILNTLNNFQRERQRTCWFMIVSVWWTGRPTKCSCNLFHCYLDIHADFHFHGKCIQFPYMFSLISIWYNQGRQQYWFSIVFFKNCCKIPSFQFFTVRVCNQCFCCFVRHTGGRRDLWVDLGVSCSRSGRISGPQYFNTNNSNGKWKQFIHVWICIFFFSVAAQSWAAWGGAAPGGSLEEGNVCAPPPG